MAGEMQSFYECSEVAVLALASATISGKFTVPHVFWMGPKFKDKFDLHVALTEQSHWFITCR